MRGLIIFGVVGAGCLSACGASSPGAGSSSSSVGSGSAQSAGGSATQGDGPQACSVITQTEAAAVLGSSVTSQGSGHTCIWSDSSGGELNVQAYLPGTSAASVVPRACNFGTPVPVSGVGDAAVYCSTPGQTSTGLVFAKRGVLVQLQCGAASSSAAPCDKSRFVAAAQAAAGRL